MEAKITVIKASPYDMCIGCSKNLEHRNVVVFRLGETLCFKCATEVTSAVLEHHTEEILALRAQING